MRRETMNGKLCVMALLLPLLLVGCTSEPQYVMCPDGTKVLDFSLCPKIPTPTSTPMTTPTPIISPTTDELPPLPPDSDAPSECTSAADCHIGGCSGTICSTDANAVSTCEWSEEYACYRQISCGCIENKCVWVKTPEFEQCVLDALSAPPYPYTNDDELPPMPI